MQEYDVIIIGGGPAGLTAGLYTARARRKSLLMEKGLLGGLITYASEVENFPGFPEGISGMELGERLHQQATKYGLETIYADATGIKLQGERKVITTAGGDFSAGAVIVASGSERLKLGIPGEEEFTGRGVSFCATCDASFFADQPVAVIGGSNAALNEALDLAKVTSRVTLIHRRDQLRATRILQERAFSEPKIEIMWNTTASHIEGTGTVKQLRLRNVLTGEGSILEIAGVFIAIGFKPNTEFVKELLPLDEDGQIFTNRQQETEIAGIFAAGDVRSGSPKQAIAAAGDGATAGFFADRFLSK